MNRFISFFALLAVASAAPAAKSDADPAIHILGRAPITSVGGLTTYANGAVVPTDTPAVAAATAQHLAAKGTPILQDVAVAAPVHYGYAGWPYAHYLGKREADSDADILIPGRAPITSVGAFTTYANGAVVPTDTPAVAAATSAHLAARGTPALHTGLVAHYGYAGYPYAHYLGKREADSEADPAIHILGRAPITSVGGFTTYANGAVVPTDTPAVAAATAQHLAAKGTPILHDVAVAAPVHYGYAGYPYAHYLGKREAESDADAYYGVLGYGYGLQHVPAVTSVGGLTTYSNGAVVPTDPANLAATSAHLAGKGLHGLHLIGKREAEPYYGIYGAYPVTSSVITSINPALTTYANGAVVPTDPNNLAATSAHLAEKAHRIGLLG